MDFSIMTDMTFLKCSWTLDYEIISAEGPWRRHLPRHLTFRKQRAKALNPAPNRKVVLVISSKNSFKFGCKVVMQVEQTFDKSSHKRKINWTTNRIELAKVKLFEAQARSTNTNNDIRCHDFGFINGSHADRRSYLIYASFMNESVLIRLCYQSSGSKTRHH